MKTIGTFVLVATVLLIFPRLAIAGSKRNKRYDRVWKKRMRQCKETTCAHIPEMENDNCINKCVSPSCFEEHFGGENEPFEPGEIDYKRTRAVQTCFRLEEKARQRSVGGRRGSKMAADANRLEDAEPAMDRTDF
jgi:hypothetical protein